MDKVWCQYCGKEKAWDDMDLRYGRLLAERSLLARFGYVDDDAVAPCLICQTCAEESKREGDDNG